MKSQTEPLDDMELIDLAVRMVLAMMRSASTDNVKPMDWWDRARTALEASASVAESWSQMVSKFGAKIQVISLKDSSAREICSVGDGVTANWDRFRALAQRDALYITAMAQARRAEEKVAWTE